MEKRGGYWVGDDEDGIMDLMRKGDYGVEGFWWDHWTVEVVDMMS